MDFLVCCCCYCWIVAVLPHDCSDYDDGVNTQIHYFFAAVVIHFFPAVATNDCFLVVVHATYLLIAFPFTLSVAIALVRDAVLIVLIQWQVQWIAASYRIIYNVLIPPK